MGTDSNAHAFLGACFGMPVSEVKKALKKSNAVLLDFATYKRTEPEVLNSHPFNEDGGAVSVYEEDRRNSFSLYMPSIEMFNSLVQAQFDFDDNRLTFVAVFFRRMPLKDSSGLVRDLDLAIKRKYEFVGEEKSKEVPAAYTLQYKSTTVEPALWVNLTDRKDPIIALFIKYLPYLRAKEKATEMREKGAL